MTKKRIIVGISGASGITLAKEVIQAFRLAKCWEVFVIATPSAVKTAELEFVDGINSIYELSDYVCNPDDISHSISSGTFRTEGMIIVPCSMKTLAGINHGYSDNLLLRAADVTLKQRRKLVIVPRESPLGIIHLKNMLELAQIGCIIIPPVLTYYHLPKTIEDMSKIITEKIIKEFIEDTDKHYIWENG